MAYDVCFGDYRWTVYEKIIKVFDNCIKMHAPVENRV